MATKPTDLPRFANGGSADVVEPSSGEKDLGWVAGAKLPAQFLNWLFEKIYEWMVYLDDGIIQHSTKTKQLPAAIAESRDSTDWQYSASVGASASSWTAVSAGANEILSFPIPLEIGERILEIRVYCQDTAAANTISAELFESDNTGGNTSRAGPVASAGDGSNQVVTLDLTGGGEQTLGTNKTYHLQIETDTGTQTTTEVFWVEVDYDRVTS